MLRIGVVLIVITAISLGTSVFVATLAPTDEFIHPLVAIVTFAMLFYAFDRWLWRFPLWRSIGLIVVDDVYGKWDARLITSYNDQSVIENATVFIRQHWLTMSVHFASKTAESNSLAAAIFKHESGDNVLAYIYRTKPNADAPSEVQPHIGLCVLRHNTEDDQLNGYYHYFYYDDERMEFIRGQFNLTRHQDMGLPVEAP